MNCATNGAEETSLCTKNEEKGNSKSSTTAAIPEEATKDGQVGCAENPQQLLLEQTISDISRDTRQNSKIKSIELPGVIGWNEEQQQDNNILFEKEYKIIGNDLWR